MPKRGEQMADEQKRKISESLRSRTISKTKRCPKCGETKDRERDFGKRKNGYSRSRCRACEKAASRRWALANPEKVKATNRRTTLRRWLGLTEEQYDALLHAQSGRCAICRRTSAEVPGGRLHVDHCHATGRVRGLLCSPCNTAIGLFYEDPSRLIGAIAYLGTARGRGN
jgi:hypothetical protein